MSYVLPAGLRDRALLEAARTAAAAAAVEDRSLRSRDFAAGALAAYAWLLGTAGGPLSGSAGPSSIADVIREEEFADDSIYRRRGAVDVRPGWATGVQHALMWARGAADDPPVNIPTNEPDPVPRFRSREELVAALAVARGRLDAGRVVGLEQYDGGVIAACQWLLGETSIAPVTGDSCPATLDRVGAEYRVADDTGRRRPGAVDIAQRFAQGAALTLYWATHVVARPPVRVPGATG